MKNLWNQGRRKEGRQGRKLLKAAASVNMGLKRKSEGRKARAGRRRALTPTTEKGMGKGGMYISLL